MAAMEGYMDLLNNAGHKCTLSIISGIEMKKTRVKAAKHIFQQCKKGKIIPANAVFDKKLVDVSDIGYEARYYEGFTFIPSIAAHFCKIGRHTWSSRRS